MTFLPKDLTPAQRAALKLASHFVLIAVFNALLAGYVWLSDGNAFSWRGVILVVGAQVALAVLDALKKYLTAQGDLSFSALLELARLQLAQHTPPVVYTPAQQVLQNSVNTVFAPEPSTAALVAPDPAHPPVSPAVAPDPAGASLVAPVDPSLEDTAPRPVLAPAQ